MSGEKLPSLPLPHPQASYSSGSSSPRVGSIASSISSHSGSQSSFTSAASSNGPKTPSPTLPLSAGIPGQSGVHYDHYPAMSQPQDMYYSQPHMSGGQAPPPQTTSGGMTHYSHAQPPLLQPGPAQYPAPPASYSHQYGYANGMTSPPTAPPVSGAMGSGGLLPPPGSLPGMPGQSAAMQNQYTGFDTTGQIAPPGMKPRVTATLWEDEGSLCFQVEARGICVARREDNHMINGTKLLNVAGMTRGRRDGILKSEKVRHVVKIGPMHLKGVWIPFERALDFANKEKITELLYPLFVHNIGALLYHPTNQNRTSQVMAAAERRKQEQSQIRNSQPAGPGLPSIQHHHHSMALPPGPQASLPSQSNMGRPSLDRAQTFPTPPTSASSAIGSMGASDGFQWAQQQQGMSGAQGTGPMTVDTGLSNARSMPNTPATTPPGSNMQSMQSYPSVTQSYDSSRQMYSTSTQQSPYQTSATTPQDRSMYGQQPNSYGVKNEMGPPSSRPAGTGPGGEQQDTKPPNGVMHPDQGGQSGHHHEDEADHEHDTEYTHDSGYDANRTAYNYPAPVGSLPSEHTQLSPEMTGSPHHPPTSGRATPRTAAAPQPYYSQQTGYTSPPRTLSASNNVYNVMNNDRGSTNGAPANDVYAPQADMGNSMANGYAAQPPVMNGGSGGIKRQREDEDEAPRPSSGGPGMGGLDLKRRKTMGMESSVPAPAYDAMNRPGSAVSAPRRSLMI